RLAEGGQITTQRRQSRQNTARPLLDSQSPQTQVQGGQVEGEGIRGNGEDAQGEDLVPEILGPRSTFATREGLVVDVLLRDVHQGQVQGPFGGPNVLAGDGAAVAPDVLQECPAGPPGLLLSLTGKDALEVLQRELGVDRNQAAGESNDRIDFFAIGESMLDLVVRCGKDVAQEILQKLLAQATANLGGAQDVLKAAQVLTHFG